MTPPPTLLISSLLDGYRARHFSPVEVMEQVLASIGQAPDRGVWITLLPRDRVLQYAAALAARDPSALPLYGIPFAIKDNIDLADVPTTAGCPDYAYTPVTSAFVVSKLIEAGAIPIGKTNLDQFATGLVGTRSPYGPCRNSFNPDYISGGSSSGSAVAVATGLVSFALGTDTAGSGRIPAAFNNIVGLKATCGALSTRGVVPACRSLDCVSIFTLTADDAARVYNVAAVFDPEDAYSRPTSAPAVNTSAASAAGAAHVGAGAADVDEVGTQSLRAGVADVSATNTSGTNTSGTNASAVKTSIAHPALSTASASNAGATHSGASGPRRVASSFRFGVPRASQLEFFGDAEYARLFGEAVTRLEALGGRRVEIDFEPFLATARLLYEGPWVAERYCAVGDFVDRSPESVYPVTRQIISGGRNQTAADAFRAQYRLMELRRAAESAWVDFDVLLTPTAGTIYRIDAVNADPIRLNSNLGYYTNFVNLLDLAAVAAPSGFRADGLPFGVTFIGRSGTDAQLLTLADRFHRATSVALGALSVEVTTYPSASAVLGQGTHDLATTANTAVSAPAPAAAASLSARISVAVCGAHMEGLPLNHQLTTRDAILISRTRTAPVYKFFALPGGPPHRPGLVRVATGGASIEVEVWSVPTAHFGSFVAGIPAPLGIGKVELENGTQVPGFICEPYATTTATDITALGSWRRYLT